MSLIRTSQRLALLDNPIPGEINMDMQSEAKLCPHFFCLMLTHQKLDTANPYFCASALMHVGNVIGFDDILM